jgi:hypothetical protein
MPLLGVRLWYDDSEPACSSGAIAHPPVSNKSERLQSQLALPPRNECPLALRPISTEAETCSAHVLDTEHGAKSFA